MRVTRPTNTAARLLLQITAMRYQCLNHTSDAACSNDQGNWCVLHRVQACTG
jgi:hypothetical protein